MNELFTSIAQLGIKMRIYRAIQIADSDAGDLRDREILILELLNTQGPMSMSDLLRFFPGIKQSTLSADVKRLRLDLEMVDMTVDRKDMRVHLIELSEKGLEKVRQIQAQRGRTYLPLSEAIGDDEEEIGFLKQVVDRAIALVNEEINRFAESQNAT